MRLISLTQLNVRNLRTPRLEFPPGIIAVVGRNASGKSNLLEAAYLGCTGLAAARTKELLRLGEEEGYVAAEVKHAEGVTVVEIGLAAGRRVVRVDGQAARVSDVAQVVTAVLLTPEDAELVHGSPSGRRSYLDGLLMRLSARYAAVLRENNRVLEQRNALLRTAPTDPSLSVWTSRFLALANEVESVRARAMGRLGALAADSYAEIAGAGSPPLAVTLKRSYEEATLEEALARAAHEERARGMTTVGPHRDDLQIALRGHPVREYGSRGEARTAALSLKVAEHRLLTEKHGEPPVLLVDDFTAELDEGRREYLLELIGSNPQALVSGTEPPPHYDHLFRVDAGTFTAEGGQAA